MTRAQRAVRVSIWLLMPFLLLGSLDLAVTLFSQFRQDRDLHSLLSPDGRYAATLNIHQASCGYAQARASQSVFVERRFAGLKTGMYSPFCVDQDGAKVDLYWRNSRELLIACEGCSNGSYAMSSSNWGDVRFVFDLDR